MLFNYFCDIFEEQILRKNFSEKTESVLKYEKVPCYITEDSNAYFRGENSRDENTKRVKISIPLDKKYIISVWDSILVEWEKYRIEDISARKFASKHRGSYLIKAIKIYE